jgi:hypothetical protein
MYKSGDLLGGLTKLETKFIDYFKGAAQDVAKGGKDAFDDLSKSSNPLIQSFVDLTSIVKELEGIISSEPTKEKGKIGGVATKIEGEKVKLEKAIEESKSTTPPQVTTTNEIKFSEPLKIEISLTGAQGMSEIDLRNLLAEGKLSQELTKAINEAILQKIKK